MHATKVHTISLNRTIYSLGRHCAAFARCTRREQHNNNNNNINKHTYLSSDMHLRCETRFNTDRSRRKNRPATDTRCVLHRLVAEACVRIVCALSIWGGVIVGGRRCYPCAAIAQAVCSSTCNCHGNAARTHKRLQCGWAKQRENACVRCMQSTLQTIIYYLILLYPARQTASAHTHLSMPSISMQMQRRVSIIKLHTRARG